MKCSRRRAHHDCAVLERNLIRKDENISTRDFDELGIASVPMLSDHLPFAAELFVTSPAKVAATAADQIMHIHAVAGRNVVDVSRHSIHAPSYYVPESNGQGINGRDSSEIVR